LFLSKTKLLQLQRSLIMHNIGYKPIPEFIRKTCAFRLFKGKNPTTQMHVSAFWLLLRR
jgi:hypothetical protein